MKAVILAGGQGSRLRPLTEQLPKPMVTVLGRPMMEHIVDHLRHHGFDDVVATLHYRPGAIKDHFGDGSDWGITLDYTLETEPLGTAGSVKLSERHLDSTFLVIAGDALMDFDLGAFLRFHRANQAKVSLCLSRVNNPSEFGIVITDEVGRVQRFLEKPSPGEVFSDTVNTGIYLIEPEVLQDIPPGRSFDFSGDLFPTLLERGEPIYGYVADGYWSDIGTLEQLRQSHWDMLDNKVSLPLAGNRVDEQVWLGDSTEIAENAMITGPCWIGRNVRIHDGARVGPYAVIGNNVEVDRFATIHRSLVMRNSFIGESSDLHNCIVASKNIVEARCELGDDVAIGAGCRLGAQVEVRPGVLVWPDKQVYANSTLVENLIWEALNRPSIFGSRGVSGLANLHVTPELAVVLGKAYGTWIGMGRRVSASRDNHPFSRIVQRAIVSGLLSVGIHVDDLEESSSPVTRFLVGNARRTAGGIHVRLSEEHPSMALIELFNGEGLPLVRKHRRKVEATFHRGDFPKVSVDQVGQLRYPGQVHGRYLDQLLEATGGGDLAQQGKRIVYHAADPDTALVLADLLGQSGLPMLNRAADDPTLTHQVSEIARLNRALALILHRDGETLGVVDEYGHLLDPERVEALLTVVFMRTAPRDQPLFLAPDRPAFLVDLAKQQDRPVLITRKEHAARLAEIQEQVGGGSSWLEFRHFYLGLDALAASLNLLAFLSAQQIGIHELEREIPTTYRYRTTIPCPWDQMGRIMRELAQRPEADIEQVPEGVRLIFEGRWSYVVPSADAPELELTTEAGNPETLSRFLEEIQGQIRRLIGR